jgi:hypothetical protein
MTALQKFRKLWSAPNPTTKTNEGVLRWRARHLASWASLSAVVVLSVGLLACPPKAPPPPPVLFDSIKPNPVDFGNVSVGSKVTIDVNIRGKAFTAISVSISGAEFTETDNCANPASGVCDAQVSVQPIALGPLTGQVVVTGIVAGKAPHEVPVDLTAFGVQTGSALKITTSSLASGVVNAPYPKQTVQTAGGTPPVSFSIVSGGLPPGLTMDTSGNITGTGTLTGTSSFTVKAVDSSSPLQKATDTLSITIAPVGGPLSIITTTLPGGVAGTPYNATVQATGGKQPYTFDIIGTLPGGLIMDNQGNITGTPSGPASTTPFTVTVKDSNPPPQTASANLSINITQQGTLAITPSTLPNGVVGVPYNQTLTVTGGAGGPFAWSVSNGTLPAGLMLDQTSTASTTTIAGTPTTPQNNVMFTIGVADASKNVVTQLYTVTIIANTGNHDSQIIGPNVVFLEGVDAGQAPFTAMLSYTADGKGAGTNCLAIVNASTIVNNATCTLNYNVDNSNAVTMTATVNGQATPFTLAGNLDSLGNAGVILTGGPANLVSGASGDSFKQDPTAFSLPAQQGSHFFVLGGQWNGNLFTGLGQGSFDNSGSANPSTIDLAQPGMFQFQSGDAIFSLSSISAASGCGTGIATFLGTPPTFESFQSNEATCIVDIHMFLAVGTDPPSASVPDRLHVIAHDSLNRDVGRHPVRLATLGPQGSQETAADTLAAAAAVANPAQLNGAYTARLQGVSGSGASATNSIMLFKFTADGAGNITSGILDQINGGTLTTIFNISGSTYTADATTPGRVTIHLNSNGTTLIDNDFTAYIGASAGGSIMAGTTAHPSTQLGIGVVIPQGGFPFSPASFGSGCPVTSVHPVATSNWTLTGSMDFSAGITNFNSIFSFVKGGTPTSGQAVTGTFTLTDPNTGRFTGNLTGFPGTTGAVVGYLNGPNLFSFALSTSSTSSALITCVGQ